MLRLTCRMQATSRSMVMIPHLFLTSGAVYGSVGEVLLVVVRLMVVVAREQGADDAQLYPYNDRKHYHGI